MRTMTEATDCGMTVGTQNAESGRPTLLAQPRVRPNTRHVTSAQRFAVSLPVAVYVINLQERILRLAATRTLTAICSKRLGSNVRITAASICQAFDRILMRHTGILAYWYLGGLPEVGR
jgi:hypothetical protein